MDYNYKLAVTMPRDPVLEPEQGTSDGVQPRGPETGSNVTVLRGSVDRGPGEGGVASGGPGGAVERGGHGGAVKEKGGGQGGAMKEKGGGQGGAMKEKGGGRDGALEDKCGVQPRGPETGSNVTVVRGSVNRGTVEGGVASGGGQGGAVVGGGERVSGCGGALERQGGSRGGSVERQCGVQTRGPEIGSNVPVVRGAVGSGPVEGGVMSGGGQGGAVVDGVALERLGGKQGGGRGGCVVRGCGHGGPMERQCGVQSSGPETGTSVTVVRGAVGSVPVEGIVASEGGQGGAVDMRAVTSVGVSMTSREDDRVQVVSEYVTAVNKYSNQKNGGIYELPPIEYSGSCLFCQLNNTCIGPSCMKLKGII